jgi:ERCC4-related helicase
MLPIKSLRLSASNWQFLSDPEQYVEASDRAGRTLVLESTRRQFRTAQDILTRLTGGHGERPRRGILLADDVGLGKTTVASLVAWVVASAGERSRVRILAPNDVMVRRWAEELHEHVKPLRGCAPRLDIQPNQVKARIVRSLKAGCIQVVTHSYVLKRLPLNCELLIVDEAHRAKGANAKFTKALKRKSKDVDRLLFLTATPFSIDIHDLMRMLGLIEAEAARGPVAHFSRALDRLYSGSAGSDPEGASRSLASRAQEAVKALRPFVIRHGIEDLPREHLSFGTRVEWPIDVPPANPEELELMLRMDRARRLARHDGSESTKARNDPRFYVGWRHFDDVRERLKEDGSGLLAPTAALVENHLRTMGRLRRRVGVHPKLKAVAEDVKRTIELGEKVLLFCHHHATAQELTLHLASVLPKVTAPRSPGREVWRVAWNSVLEPPGEEPHEATLRATFIAWLCADLIRAQTLGWLHRIPASADELAMELKESGSRYDQSPQKIAEAAQNLFRTLLLSKSSRAVLRAAADMERLELLPGANGSSRVLGVCMPSEAESEESLFIHNQQPDTVISIFNSPFGPDVLVVTDKLSEGIDLHRYCRHLIHYELDPSPIRTVQRNGRLRRVNSWAAATGQPIKFAYPAFQGTRDHRLVRIMKKRIDSFSLLLGGVQDFDLENVDDADEKWRNDVIALAKSRLAKVGGQLRARVPGEP